MKPDYDRHKTDRFLNELLDASLKGYGSAGERVGLEDRVLRSLREQPAPRMAWITPWLKWPMTWRWLPLVVTATTAVVIFSLVMTHRPQEAINLGSTKPGVTQPDVSMQPQPVTNPAQVQSAVPPARSAKRAPQRTSEPVVHFALVRPDSLMPMSEPRLAQFPMPTPPTEQEMLLMRLAAENPAALAAWAAVANAPIKPLADDIKPLVIVPLSNAAIENTNPASAPPSQPIPN